MHQSQILVVEDDKCTRDCIVLGLKTAGFHVTEFDSADSALELNASQLLQFDTVLTDYQMPGMNGVQFARYMKALNPNVQILIMSGRVIDFEDQTKDLGLTLQKPFRLHELTSLIENLPSSTAVSIA